VSVINLRSLSSILLLLSVQVSATEYATPFEAVYVRHYGSDNAVFNRYAKHYQDTYGDIVDALNNEPKTDNSKVLNGLYDYYKMGSYKEIRKIIEFNLESVKNSFQGVFIQDIMLKEKKALYAENIVSFGMCRTLKYRADKLACMGNNIAIACINGSNYTNNMKILELDSPSVAHYAVNYCEKYGKISK
jgi:hypothetical protein